MPFQTGSYTTSASGSSNPFTTVERKDIGVTLKVTPHIGEDRMLRLEIEQEISSIAPTATLAAKAVDLVTNKRSIKSTVLADDGQVIVLGGLIQDDLLRSDSRVPLLGDIPGVGRLFRSSRETRVKRNLMVFLRPSIVRDAAGLERISHGRYRSIQLLRGAAGEPARPLFEDAGAIDLRPAAQVAPAPIGSPRSYPAPAPVLMEKPRLADPASLGDGRGGEVPEVRQGTHAPQPPSPQRYAVRLVEGSSEAFMRALIERHPGLSLRLRRELRDGQEPVRGGTGRLPRPGTGTPGPGGTARKPAAREGAGDCAYAGKRPVTDFESSRRAPSTGLSGALRRPRSSAAPLPDLAVVAGGDGGFSSRTFSRAGQWDRNAWTTSRPE